MTEIESESESIFLINNLISCFPLLFLLSFLFFLFFQSLSFPLLCGVAGCLRVWLKLSCVNIYRVFVSRLQSWKADNAIVYCCILLLGLCSLHISLWICLFLSPLLSLLPLFFSLSFSPAVLSLRKTKSHFQCPTARQSNLKRCAPIRC